MKRIFPVSLAILVSIVVTTGLANGQTEVEPNDTFATANAVINRELKTGAITSGNLDYFSFNGVNTTWGFIALLETDLSSSSKDGLLTALGSDGTTVLQADMGSWEKGSGIALQNYADGNATHYFRVNESGDDQAISAYTLRYYSTIVNGQPELEPNETRSTGTPSSYTHEGVLSSGTDVDCFAFQGRSGDAILLALNGDPEQDSSPADAVLELLDFDDIVLATADNSGLGGNEFIEYKYLSADGVYAYCVNVGSGTGGTDATYKVGLVRNGDLYTPDFVRGPTWLNPRPGNIAYIGDILSFKLAITNTGPLTIPDYITLNASFDPECLRYMNATETPSQISSNKIDWQKVKTDLAPSEEFSITVYFEAITACSDSVRQGTYVSYYFNGGANDVFYTVPRFPWSMFLPAINNNAMP